MQILVLKDSTSDRVRTCDLPMSKKLVDRMLMSVFYREKLLFTPYRNDDHSMITQSILIMKMLALNLSFFVKTDSKFFYIWCLSVILNHNESNFQGKQEIYQVGKEFL